jgi:dolichol-phosphate mannosyltransferase
MKKLVSIVVPTHNEAAGISHFHRKLRESLPNRYRYELLYVDDGSTDSTLEKLKSIREKDSDVHIISFSKNFGKEAATTAGINESKGDATIIIDGDGQHPVELINSFLKKWEKGAQVVIGLRANNKNEGPLKHYGSKLFYRIFNLITKERLVPNSTDFRLISAEVRLAFGKLNEHNRITRALIDWLGYKKEYVTFTANAREFGEATYTMNKLVKLAMNSFISLTTFPLLLSGYLGIIITPMALFVGLFIIIEQYMMGDPLSLKITGSASLGVFIVFLVGIILTGQGLIALYTSRIHEEVKNRPHYIIDYTKSTDTTPNHKSS